MTETVRKLIIAPFNYVVNIVVTDSIVESRMKRNHVLVPAKKDDLTGTAAMHSAVPDRPISFIFLPVECDIGYVAHECYHCIWHMMDYIGATHENEIMAYMLGYLVRECTRVLVRQQGVISA